MNKDLRKKVADAFEEAFTLYISEEEINERECYNTETDDYEIKIYVDLGDFDLTFDALKTLSDLLGTKDININYEKGYFYSEYTWDGGSCTLFIGGLL